MFELFVIFSLIAFIPVAYFEMQRRKPVVFEPIFMVNCGFFASYLLKACLVQLSNKFITYPSLWVDPPSLLPYFVLSWTALMILNLGYYALVRPQITPVQQTPKPENRFLYLLFIAISVLSSVNILSRIDYQYLTDGTMGPVEGLRFAVMRAWTTGGLDFIFPIFAGFFHLGYEIEARAQSSRIERGIVALLVLFVLLVIGGRAYLLSWVLAFVAHWLIFVRYVQVRWQLLFLMLFPLVGGVLGIAQKLSGEGSKALEMQFPLNILYRLSSSYEQFEVLVDTIYANFKFDLGYSIFEDIFVTYLPRVIFTFKPLDYGFLRAQTVVFETFWSRDRGTSYPLGILGELYFNFGYFGIFGGMLLLGAILAHLRNLAFSDPKYIAPFCMVGATLMSPNRFFGQLLQMIILYLIAAYVSDIVGKLIRRKRAQSV